MSIDENISSSSFLDRKKYLKFVILKDFIEYFPAKLFLILNAFLLIPVYTYILPVKEYGLYQLALSFLNLLCTLSTDWVAKTGLRFYDKYNKVDKLESYLSNILFLLLLNITIAYSVCFLFLDFLSKSLHIPQKLILAVVLLVIPCGIRQLIFYLLRVLSRPFLYTFSVIINQLSVMILAIAFIKYFNMASIGIILSMATVIFIMDLILLYIIKLKFTINFKKISLNTLKTYWGYGFPTILSNLSVWVILHSNKFIMQYLGLFQLNAMLGFGWHLTSSILSPLFSTPLFATFPRIISRYESKLKVNNLITKAIDYYILLFTPLVFIFYYFAKEIVMLVSNKSYIQAIIVIPFFAVSLLLYDFIKLINVKFHLNNATYLETVITSVSGLFSLILNIILIPRLHLLGAGIAILSSTILLLILSIAVKNKEFNFINWPDLLNAIKCVFVSLFLSHLFLLVLNQILNFHKGVFCLIEIIIFTTVYVSTALAYRKLTGS